MGQEEPNKKLSERRAAAIHAFLIKDKAVWESQYNEDKWGLATIQELLKHHGHEPGAIDGKDGPKTQAAVKAFQSKKGISATGVAGASTRQALFQEFMDAWYKGTLVAKDFDVIDGKAHAGCSEFNRVEDAQGACAANRRVAVFLLKSTKNFPIQYPCKHGDVGPCRKQAGRKGERRTKGFGCLFYDKLVKEIAGASGTAKKVGTAVFQAHKDHPFGYDKHGKMEAEDQNGDPVDFKGEPELDYLSVEAGKKGLVELRYEKMDAKDIVLILKDASKGTVSIKDPTAKPLVVEVNINASKSIAETSIETHFGSPDGPLLSEIGLVILPPLEFMVKYIRVEDPKNPKTKLTTSMTKDELQEGLNTLYTSGAAKWKITGEDAVTELEYDIVKNGSVDLEPGIESVEEKKLKSLCEDKGTTILHVHDLRWSYFLTKTVKPEDTVLHVKDYGGYLDYIGLNTYTIEDGAGNSTSIEVASVDKAKFEVTLTAPIGVEFKLVDSPALLWPLGGLSGNPTWVSDIGTKEDLIIYSAHELGHTLAKFDDIVEKENIMFGGYSTGKGLRHRPIPKYYHPDQSEAQWTRMRPK